MMHWHWMTLHSDCYRILGFPCRVGIEIAVAPGNSTSVNDAIATFPLYANRRRNLCGCRRWYCESKWLRSCTTFGLEIYTTGREAASDPTEVDLLVHHGSTDAPTVDVVEVGVGAGTIVDDIEYTDFQGYLELPTADYALEVRDETGAVTVAAYEAPLATLGLEGGAAVAVASGFLDPSVNSDGPAFGIWVALPSRSNGSTTGIYSKSAGHS